MKNSQSPRLVKSIVHSSLVGFGLLISTTHAAVLFQNSGDDISSFVAQGASPNVDGGTSSSANPFSVSGQSQGNNLAVSNYTWNSFTSISAADSGTQEIWISFLFARDNRSSWAGGLTFGSGTMLTTGTGSPTGLDMGGTVGWSANRSTMDLVNGTGAASGGGNTVGPAIAVGGQYAVLARIYENGTSGLFNRGDLYFDNNLADGINFGAASLSNVDLSNGANSTLNLLRLDANGNTETRYYDNITIATTQAEAIALIPEPSAALLGGLGLLALLRRRR